LSDTAATASGTAAGRPTKPEGIGLRFDGAGVTRFRLLWEEAPETCRVLVDRLPDRGECLHAAYSGTVVGILFDPTVNPPMENGSNIVLPGDLLFTHYEARSRHGHPDPLSEIYWPYDRYARPTIPGQFIPTVASVFASFDGTPEEWKEFADRSQGTRSAGGVMIDVSFY
jgi:Protein of unknown function (DUF3830)